MSITIDRMIVSLFRCFFRFFRVHQWTVLIRLLLEKRRDVFCRSKFSSFCQGVLTLCPTRNVVKQVGRKSMSFLVAFLYCYVFDACTIFLRRSYVHTYIRSMLVNLDTLADGALIVVSSTIGDALNVVSLTLSIYDLSCK